MQRKRQYKRYGKVEEQMYRQFHKHTNREWPGKKNVKINGTIARKRQYKRYGKVEEQTYL